ncbi:hypothetical protein H4P12_12365 [Paracoccus sp. 11-3]|uniref:TRAP transporter small permease subunit n=1 Tax=Paracoccus amoyensis TaxID=2760093 RepID=A0A926GAK0_9RHOB|nr:hypothetical protein [Paracoccus amoyensis]MBC9247488.1 hypothetical protein [Paracoccus amoyensis]
MRAWLLARKDVVANLLAAALCLLVVAVALRLGLDAHARGEMDIRAIEIPRWTLFALLGGGFGLCGLEFLRHALSREAAVQDRTSPLTGEA